MEKILKDCLRGNVHQCIETQTFLLLFTLSLKVTLHLQGCLASKRCSSPGLNCRYPKPYKPYLKLWNLQNLQMLTNICNVIQVILSPSLTSMARLREKKILASLACSVPYQVMWYWPSETNSNFFSICFLCLFFFSSSSASDSLSISYSPFHCCLIGS